MLLNLVHPLTPNLTSLLSPTPAPRLRCEVAEALRSMSLRAACHPALRAASVPQHAQHLLASTVPTWTELRASAKKILQVSVCVFCVGVGGRWVDGGVRWVPCFCRHHFCLMLFVST